MQPFLFYLIYWKEPTHGKNFIKVRDRRCNSTKKLSHRDYFLNDDLGA